MCRYARSTGESRKAALTMAMKSAVDRDLRWDACAVRVDQTRVEKLFGNYPQVIIKSDDLYLSLTNKDDNSISHTGNNATGPVGKNL